MQKIRGGAVVLLLIVTLVALTAAPAAADHEDLCEVAPTGAAFGFHIMLHALLQMLGMDMNPGTHHQGYSPCVP